MTSTFWRTALVLGLLSAVGPFAIDMYLPAMPAIEADLNASILAVQNTLVFYFLAFGVSQLVYGPIADRYGRKPPLVVGLVIFILGAALAALAPDTGWLTAARFVQGIGAAAVMVVPRAIIRDQMTGTDAARMMAAIMMVISVSPMLAPLAGAGLLAIGDWRLIFWALAIAGVASLAVTILLQPETLRPEDQTPFSLSAMRRGAGVLFSDPVFMGLTLLGAFGFASFFVFIASASFVYTTQFNLSPAQFGLAFAANAIGFFAASQFAAPLGVRFGMARVMQVAAIGFACATVLLLMLALAGLATLPVIILCLVAGNAFLGLIIPSAMVMALDDHGDVAGLASSLGGTLQMVIGGAVTVAAGPFFDGTALPMIGAIAACAVITLGLSFWVMPRLRVQAA